MVAPRDEGPGRRNDCDSRPDNPDPVALPQLLQTVSAKVLVDLVKYIGQHGLQAVKHESRGTIAGRAPGRKPALVSCGKNALRARQKNDTCGIDTKRLSFEYIESGFV